jgi:hypothetical protein
MFHTCDVCLKPYRNTQHMFLSVRFVLLENLYENFQILNVFKLLYCTFVSTRTKEALCPVREYFNSTVSQRTLGAKIKWRFINLISADFYQINRQMIPHSKLIL